MACHCSSFAITECTSETCEEGLPDTTSMLQLGMNMVSDTSPDASFDYGHPSWLAACKSIFLDLGSNIGVQVRKLYEPKLYPEADLLPIFEEIFGSPLSRCAPANESGLCALGLEPNPNHQPRLQYIEKAYAEKGWHVHFYPFAAAYEDGTAEFTVNDSTIYNDWGAGLALAEKERNVSVQKRNVSVQTVDLGAFLKSLPAHTVSLMKMDIEGGEWESLASMEAHQVLCSEWIRNATIEVHEGRGSKEHWAAGRNATFVQDRLMRQTCSVGPVPMLEVDDETYIWDSSIQPGYGSDCSRNDSA